MSDYAKRLEYDGFCNHDCENYYHCPACGAQYTGWWFFHRGIKEGEKFNCDSCGILLVYGL